MNSTFLLSFVFFSTFIQIKSLIVVMYFFYFCIFIFYFRKSKARDLTYKEAKISYIFLLIAYLIFCLSLKNIGLYYFFGIFYSYYLLKWLLTKLTNFIIKITKEEDLLDSYFIKRVINFVSWFVPLSYASKAYDAFYNYLKYLGFSNSTLNQINQYTVLIIILLIIIFYLNILFPVLFAILKRYSYSRKNMEMILKQNLKPNIFEFIEKKVTIQRIQNIVIIALILVVLILPEWFFSLIYNLLCAVYNKHYSGWDLLYFCFALHYSMPMDAQLPVFDLTKMLNKDVIGRIIQFAHIGTTKVVDLTIFAWIGNIIINEFEEEKN